MDKIELEEKSKDFLIALMQNLRNDMEFLKRQQWTIAHYGLLLLGAIVALYKIPNGPDGCLTKGLLFAVAVAVWIFCLVFILMFHNTLEADRKFIEDIYKDFPDAHRRHETHFNVGGSSSFGNTSLHILLPAFLLLGLVAVGWVLFR